MYSTISAKFVFTNYLLMISISKVTYLQGDQNSFLSNHLTIHPPTAWLIWVVLDNQQSAILPLQQLSLSIIIANNFCSVYH